MRSRSNTLVALSLLMLLASVGRASPAVADAERGYEEAIRHAVEEYSLGHWAEAKVFFLRAHAMHPTARTLRGLGLTCYESRSYVEAIGYFQAALASDVQPLTDAMRANLTQLLSQSQQFVTHVKIELSPENASLSVDRSARLTGPDGDLLLDPGEHELLAAAPGYRAQRRSVNATGGQLYLQLRLTREPHAPPSAAAVALANAEPQAPAAGLAPYLLIGSSAAAAIAGGVVLAIALSDKAAVERASGTWPDLESRYDRGRTFFPLGYALTGVGLCGVAAGLTWKLWPEREERAAQLSVTPTGFSVRGRL